MPRRAVDFHHEQEHPWSCVAACVCMIQAWTGMDPAPDEAALLASWPAPRTDIRHLAGIGDLRLWDSTDPRSVDRLRAALHRGWLVVTLFPGPLTHFTLARTPAPRSRHGRLVAHENARAAIGPPHAVVLVEARDPDGVRYLDPYYPPDGQPFSLAEDELAEAWTGYVLIPRLPAPG